MKRAVYAGTFDPLTLGHADVAARAARLFDEVVVAIGHNPGKQRMLSLDERLSVLREDLGGLPGCGWTTSPGCSWSTAAASRPG